MINKNVYNKLAENAKGPVDEKILGYILDDFDCTGYMNDETICFNAGCTLEELHGCLNNLGFENMLEFKDAVRSLTYSDQNKDAAQSINDIANMVMRYEMTNISELVAKLDTDKLDQLAQDMISATDVYLIASSAGSLLAPYALRILGRIGINIHLMGGAEDYTTPFVNMKRSGLVLNIMSARYQKSAIHTLTMLREAGFRIVSLTDHPTSPAAKLSNYYIEIPSHSYDFTDSIVSGNMLLNILALYIASKDKDALIRRLRKFDDVTTALDLYI